MLFNFFKKKDTQTDSVMLKNRPAKVHEFNPLEALVKEKLISTTALFSARVLYLKDNKEKVEQKGGTEWFYSTGILIGVFKSVKEQGEKILPDGLQGDIAMVLTLLEMRDRALDYDKHTFSQIAIVRDILNRKAKELGGKISTDSINNEVSLLEEIAEAKSIVKKAKLIKEFKALSPIEKAKLIKAYGFKTRKTDKSDDEIIKQLRAMIDKGDNITLKDVGYVTNEIVNRMEELIQEGNKEALEVNKELHNLIVKGISADAIESDGIIDDRVKKLIKTAFLIDGTTKDVKANRLNAVEELRELGKKNNEVRQYLESLTK